jgi:hypothetical protein
LPAAQVAQHHQGVEKVGRRSLLQPIQGHALTQPKAQGFGAAQAGQAAATAQGLAQVPGQGANVGAGRAGQLQLQFGPLPIPTRRVNVLIVTVLLARLSFSPRRARW